MTIADSFLRKNMGLRQKKEKLNDHLPDSAQSAKMLDIFANSSESLCEHKMKYCRMIKHFIWKMTLS